MLYKNIQRKYTLRRYTEDAYVQFASEKAAEHRLIVKKEDSIYNRRK